MKRGQSSVELLMVLAISLAILAALVNFTTEHVSNLQKEQAIHLAQNSLNRLVREINLVYRSGPGNVREIILPFPAGIDEANSRLQNTSIILRLYGSDISATAVPSLQGGVPTSEGLQRIRLISYSNYVVISLVSLVSDKESIYVAMARDSNTSTRVTFTNTGSNSADVNFSLAWTHTLVGASLPLSNKVITSGGSYSLDINLSAGGTAQGNYVGNLLVSSNLGGSIEQLTIPINVEVFSAGQALLTVIPSALEFNTLGVDTNTQSIQLCNTGSTPIKSISFTPSSYAPGTWINPAVSTISQLDGSSCMDVNVTLAVPASTAAGTYTGSLAISDYTGANNTILGLTSNVRMMNNYFIWSWDNAYTSGTQLLDFSLENAHPTKSITVNSMSVKGWSKCDQNDSLLTDIKFGGSFVYSSGSAADDANINIIDYNIPSATIISSNNLLIFSGNISDNNEQFQPALTFEDGSTYVGPVLGNGCIGDAIPPGLPTSFSAAGGPSAESIVVSFTFPGDDNQTGTVSSVDIRYATTDINTQTAFDAAASATYTGSIFSAGNTSSQLIDNLNVGYTYYFSIEFLDTNGNRSAVPPSAHARPRNTFNYLLGDFNISPFAFSRPNPSAGQTDVNEFKLRSFAGSGDRNVYLRVADDLNSSNAWIIAIGAVSGSTRANDLRIWYPANNVPGVPGMSPQYQVNPNAPMTGTLDMLSTALINSEYRYNGSYINIPNSTHLYIDWFTGFTDMNLIFDQNGA